MGARHRHLPVGIAVALIGALLLGGAAAEMVMPLPGKDCKRARVALENGLPFGPGFRRLEVEFPKNSRGIEGHVCRLLTMGTGVHMEGYGIQSLTDMRAKVMAALVAGGLKETPETARFSEKSRPGREVFALYRDNALCVTTIVVGLVDGVTPAPAAIKDGKVMLSKVMPHQREWWVSVDCFTVPKKPTAEQKVEANAEAQVDAPPEAPAEAKADVGEEVDTAVEGEVSPEALKELEAEFAPPK